MEADKKKNEVVELRMQVERSIEELNHKEERNMFLCEQLSKTEEVVQGSMQEINILKVEHKNLERDYTN